VNFSFGPANCDAYSLIWALSSELNAGRGTEAKRGEGHTPRCARTNGKRPHGAFCSSSRFKDSIGECQRSKESCILSYTPLLNDLNIPNVKPSTPQSPAHLRQEFGGYKGGPSIWISNSHFVLSLVPHLENVPD
jgi:hypothetical protein